MAKLASDTAMVMAAGLGKRMRPLTATMPKPRVRVAGKPLIDHTLDRLAEAGVARAVVNVHYLADALEAAGVSAQLLPEWYDIDSLEDLKTLAAELRHPVDSESLDRTDHTRRALASLETDWDTPSSVGPL